MSIIKHKLPVSGFELDVESEPLWEEYDAIETYVTRHTEGNVEDGEWKSLIKGEVLSDLRIFKVEVLVKAVRNKEGNPLPGTVREIMKTLHPNDGNEIISFVEDTLVSYKKKLNTTPQQ
jgi:hypothetical protein